MAVHLDKNGAGAGGGSSKKVLDALENLSEDQSGALALSGKVNEIDGEVSELAQKVEQLVTSSATSIGTVEEPLALTKNGYHKYGTLTALYFTIPANAVANDEFTIEFTCGGSVGYPNTIKWMETPTFINGNTYIISIKDNLALCAEFAND